MTFDPTKIIRVLNAGWGLPLGPARNGEVPKPFILCEGLHELAARALLMPGGLCILPSSCITGPANPGHT